MIGPNVMSRQCSVNNPRSSFSRLASSVGSGKTSVGAPSGSIWRSGCIGEHKGTRASPVSPELAHHRRTARAELYRRISRDGSPVSWGLRLFNGKGEQQITVLLPNPFLDGDDKILRTPDWSRLDLWDRLRAEWLGLGEPDPLDRSGKGFRHD